MNHLDLFAGIGGFSLAAQWMGWETVAQVEWDGWCQKVLAKNFPNTLRFGDIIEFNNKLENGEIITDCTSTDVNEWIPEGQEIQTQFRGVDNYGRKSIRRINIITGGFPCQPFSHAGKRKGTNDSRYLWPEMFTTIRLLKPSFVVGENVAGLVSMENGKTLDWILSDLENEGYTVESFIIPACAIGAWHRRDRIWIIAYSNSGRHIHRELKEQSTKGGFHAQRQSDSSRKHGQVVPNCNNQGLQGGKETRNIESIGTKRNQQFKRYSECNGGAYWQSEPSVGRVANGIPNRVDRLKGLGNAIVPQVAFEIFKAIEQYDLGNNYN